jgi:hypothetical protein
MLRVCRGQEATGLVPDGVTDKQKALIAKVAGHLRQIECDSQH